MEYFILYEVNSMFHFKDDNVIFIYQSWLVEADQDFNDIHIFALSTFRPLSNHYKTFSHLMYTIELRKILFLGKML